VSPLPRAILFDLDDTLINAYTRPDLAWLAVAGELADALAPLTPAAAAQAIGAFAVRFWEDRQRHRRGRLNLKATRRKIVRGALPKLPARVAHRLADRFTAYRDEQMHLFAGAHETLDVLRGRGVRLALITNGDGPGQRAKVERFELTHRFDHIQIEGEHGFGKPEERAYRYALAALGVECHEAWIVGDNLEWEVAAPQRLGLHAIWCDHQGAGLPDGSDVRPDRIIRAVRELID
jgi:putative hydrolase of the HAD superfamily